MKTNRIIATGMVFMTILMAQLSSGNSYSFHPEFNEDATWPGFEFGTAYAYPPAVGILGNSKNCMSCHVNNGPWKDDDNLIIDILDKETKSSLRQPDGSFLVEVKKGEQRTILTVIGTQKSNECPPPNRNAWLYIDPATIDTKALSKFAPGWDVNLPMSCRLVGDQLMEYQEANITSLPMTIHPLENANNAELQLQVMLTRGESLKANADVMQGNYFERRVILKVK